MARATVHVAAASDNRRMEEHLLESDPAFDPTHQAQVGLLTASLDDQLRRLRESVEGLSVEALEWQSAPGMNSIGMLLAHLALVEVWWIDVVPRKPGRWAEAEPRFQEVLGLRAQDDGIPLAADGAHPDALRGVDLAGYLDLLAKARACVHTALRRWSDADLDDVVVTPYRRLSKRWILYHVLEHFAGHFGQILLIRHQLRDAGLVAADTD